MHIPILCPSFSVNNPPIKSLQGRSSSQSIRGVNTLTADLPNKQFEKQLSEGIF